MKFIYKIVNMIDGKLYIGKTTQTIEERFKEHLTEVTRYKHCQSSGKDFGYESRLYKAMNKYGIENFRIELVEQVSCDADINEREKYWIKFYNTLDSNIGYNISPGGLGGPLFKGHKHTKEAKEKFSLMQKDKHWYNNGKVEIMVLKGREIPEGFSLGRIYKGLSGKDNPMYGKHNLGRRLTTETKKKLSMSLKERAKNYKKIWVTNGTIECQIDTLTQTIPDGFWKGRKTTLKRNCRAVEMFDMDGNFIKEFNSISSASRYSGTRVECIILCCQEKTKSAGGFKWKYKLSNTLLDNTEI